MLKRLVGAVASGPQQVGGIMARVGVGHYPAVEIDDAIEEGYELVRIGVAQYSSVRPNQRLGRLIGALHSKGSDERPAQGHVQGRAGAFVGHVGDQDADAAVAERHEIVEIA